MSKQLDASLRHLLAQPFSPMCEGMPRSLPCRSVVVQPGVVPPEVHEQHGQGVVHILVPLHLQGAPRACSWFCGARAACDLIASANAPGQQLLTPRRQPGASRHMPAPSSIGPQVSVRPCTRQAQLPSRQARGAPPSMPPNPRPPPPRCHMLFALPLPEHHPHIAGTCPQCRPLPGSPSCRRGRSQLGCGHSFFNCLEPTAGTCTSSGVLGFGGSNPCWQLPCWP